MYNRFACLKTTEKRSIRTKIKFFSYVKHINNIDLICCIIYAICNTYYHFYFFFQKIFNNKLNFYILLSAKFLIYLFRKIR